jgi:hypothetical protein
LQAQTGLVIASSLLGTLAALVGTGLYVDVTRNPGDIPWRVWRKHIHKSTVCYFLLIWGSSSVGLGLIISSFVRAKWPEFEELPLLSSFGLAVVIPSAFRSAKNRFAAMIPWPIAAVGQHVDELTVLALQDAVHRALASECLEVTTKLPKDTTKRAIELVFEEHVPAMAVRVAERTKRSAHEVESELHRIKEPMTRVRYLMNDTELRYDIVRSLIEDKIKELRQRN